MVDSKDFSIENTNYFTIIDSGTTISYLPKNLYSDIQKQIDYFCSQINRCMGDSFHTEIGQCYKLKENINIIQFIESMPTFTFNFENDVKYNWPPESYLFNYTEFTDNDKRQTYCIGMNSWNSKEILLGSTWMHNHDIIFDLQHKKIGLVESNCAAKNVISVYPNTQAPSNVINNDTPKEITEVPLPVISDKNNSDSSVITGVRDYNQTNFLKSCDDSTIDFYIKLIIFISIFSLVLIIILALAIHKIKRGENFLWIRVSNDETGKILKKWVIFYYFFNL